MVNNQSEREHQLLTYGQKKNIGYVLWHLSTDGMHCIPGHLSVVKDKTADTGKGLGTA